MGRKGEWGSECKKDGVFLCKRQGRALLYMTAEEDIRDIRDTRGGVLGGLRGPKQRLGYVFSHAVLHPDDTVTVYMRSLAGLWRLFGIYAAVAALALFSGRVGREGLRLWNSLTEQIGFPQYRDKASGTVKDGVDTSDSGEEGAEGESAAGFGADRGENRFVINSEKTGIIFANRDRTGVCFGYVVYADGELFESVPHAYETGGEYSLVIYGKLKAGIHELLVETYCYFGESREPFDVITQQLCVEVE